MLTNASKPQPHPVPGQQEVAAFVLQDIQERVAAGQEKYGTKLMTHNSRDALWDAYQEAIDLVMYLRQEILEREEQLSQAFEGDERILNRAVTLTEAIQELVQESQPAPMGFHYQVPIGIMLKLKQLICEHEAEQWRQLGTGKWWCKNCHIVWAELPDDLLEEVNKLEGKQTCT